VFVQLLKEWKGKPAGERIDIPDEFAPLLVEQKIAVSLTGDPVHSVVTKAMEEAAAKWAQSMDSVINLTLKKLQDAQSQARRHAVPAIFGEDGEGDTKRNFGDWLVKVATATIGKPKQAAEAAAALEKDYGSQFNPWQKAAMSELGGATGGYIVPPDFYDQLLAVVAEDSTFRQRAFVQPMASATLQFPYLDITTVQTAGVSPFFGGVQAYWTEEAQTRTETEPAFKMMELKAHELSGYSVSSNVLLQDAAFGLEKFLMTLFGRAVGWFEEYAFLQGNGVGKPLGVLNAPAAIAGGGNGSGTARNTAGHFYFQDISWFQSALLPSSYQRAVWYVSPSVIQDMLQLKDGNNRAIFISIDQGITKPPVWKLLGMPVVITEKLPALGTKGDVILIDPSLYVIGDRMTLEIAASEHVNFLKNQMTWRFVQRVDGQPWMDKPVTLQDSSTKVSPFLVLN
jgi:HK97 family phage major capsid protein